MEYGGSVSCGEVGSGGGGGGVAGVAAGAAAAGAGGVRQAGVEALYHPAIR